MEDVLALMHVHKVGNVDMGIRLCLTRRAYAMMTRVIQQDGMNAVTFHQWCVDNEVPTFSVFAKQSRDNYAWTRPGDGACFYRVVLQSILWNSSTTHVPHDYSGNLFREWDVDMDNPEHRDRFLQFLDDSKAAWSESRNPRDVQLTNEFTDVFGRVRTAVVNYASQELEVGGNPQLQSFRIGRELWGSDFFLEMGVAGAHLDARINLWCGYYKNFALESEVIAQIEQQIPWSPHDLTILCASTARTGLWPTPCHNFVRFTANEIARAFSRERHSNIVLWERHYYPMPLMEVTGENIQNAIKECTNEFFNIIRGQPLA